VTARRIAAAGASACAAVVVLAGCDSPNNTLQPHSEPARQITTLWWWMLVAATIVFLGTLGFIVIAYVLRRRQGAPLIGEGEGATRGVVLLFGFAIPIVVLIAVFTVANFAVAAHTDAPPPRKGVMRVAVVGRQWWWDVRYPGTKAVTANEIHIPVGTRVDVTVSSADVIHSFWIPKLNRKIDLIPGHPNRISLTADKPGRYYGSCAEYCGLQHAHMRMVVIAQPRARFEAWLRSAEADASVPSTARQQRGERTLMANACAACHQIRGTGAKGRVGPDLTHLMGRRSIAAGTLAMSRGNLYGWIANPQALKPGTKMPAVTMDAATLHALVAYLGTLR
jgi:cytochrome c oxidase subunit II